jgi:uncharacterized membrane protein
MKRLPVWLVFILSSAVALHIVVMRSLPSYLSSAAVDRISANSDEWKINTLGYGPLRYAGTDTVVRDNPDTVVSFAVLDLTEEPVRIHCVVPPGDNYWSVSLFAWNTDTFYVINDLEAPAPAFDLIVVKPGSLYQPVDDEQVVVSPTPRAILIVRMVVTDRDDRAEIERLTAFQQQMYVEPIEGVIY